MAAGSVLGASRYMICPLPFCKPVSAASPFTLELRHSSAALRADQVDDRRDEPAFDSPGKVSTAVIDRSPQKYDNMREAGRAIKRSRVTRPVLVGCGVRLGHINWLGLAQP